MNPPSSEEESTLGENLSDLGVGKFARTVALTTALGGVGMTAALQDPSIRGHASFAKTAIENVYHDAEFAAKTELYEHDLNLTEDALALKKELTEEIGRMPNYDEFQAAHDLSTRGRGEELRELVKEMKRNGPMSYGYLKTHIQTIIPMRLQNKKADLTVTFPKDANSLEGKEALREQVEDVMNTYQAQREGL